jgi:4-diphosphocytidyl-2-C-methyl-D-erythritol kinase
LLCPAKINLGLKVLYKRPDNYHEIASVFLKLNWGDDIYFVPNDLGIPRLFSTNELIGGKYALFEAVSERGDFTKNILFKAFQQAKDLDNTMSGVDIHLTKRIPPGGGLGGGSTNAASLLLYLLQGHSMLANLIPKMASSIGADIPFFLRTGHAYVTGIGEILKDVDISTGLLDEDLSFSLKRGDWSKLQEKFENDFEKYAFGEFPELNSLKQDLYRQGSSFVSMTGTGSCLYGFVQSMELQSNIQKWMTQNHPEHYFIQFSF